MDKCALKAMKIGVLLGGRSSERDISLKSGNAVLASLLKMDYHAVPIDAGKGLAGKLNKEKINVAFIALHGRWGEDGTVQGLLEIMGIPYTGSGILGSATAMDKVTMKLILESKGIPTPRYIIAGDEGRITQKLPFVVKPANEGSTIGISLVNKRKDLRVALETALRYDKKVLIEEFIKGQEITVAILNGKALTVVEVRPLKGFYDFEAKYTKGMTQYIVPAEISRRLAKKVQAVALDVYHGFDLAGCARVDMLIKDDIPFVIDINTSPGMTETSLVPKAWTHSGQTFDGLVEEILKGASLKI